MSGKAISPWNHAPRNLPFGGCGQAEHISDELSERGSCFGVDICILCWEEASANDFTSDFFL